MDEIEKDPTVEATGSNYDLPFEKYGKYRLVADALGQLKEDEPLRMLDVSGVEGVLQGFLAEDEVKTLDYDESGSEELPFEDETFDFTVSVDVLDHLEPGRRGPHLSEMRRLARRGVLLAAPFDSPAVRAAERTADEFYRAVHLVDVPRTGRRADHGLPALEDTRGFFEGHEDTVTVLPNGFLPHWLAMTCLDAYSSGSEGIQGTLAGLNAFYNEFVYGLDNTEPCYRRLLVSLKDPESVNFDALASSEVDSGRADAGAALFGSFSTVLPMAAEMRRLESRFEGELAEYRRWLVEREGLLARREAQIKDLSGRIAGQMSLHEENAFLKHQKNKAENQLRAITTSRAWRTLAVPLAIRRKLLTLLGRR